jgi:thymidylate synthase
MNAEETQYLDLIRDILENGSLEPGRNGDTISTFGKTMRFSLKDGQLPLLTTKRVAWKTCFRELMWFIRGRTDAKELQQQDVHIWDANGTREFLDKRGLTDYPAGVLGPIYGYQWRHFNAAYIYGNHIPHWNTPRGLGDRVETPPPYAGVDQLQQLIDALINPEKRNSRRLILTSWNPTQIDQMALPPCHVLAQFRVQRGNRLSCALYQRSGDVGLGVPFNIASYAFLTHLLAAHCGLEAEELVHFLGDAHIYVEHVDALKRQLEVDPFEFPKIRIPMTKPKIDDYDVDDIVFTKSYRHHPKIEMELKG